MHPLTPESVTYTCALRHSRAHIHRCAQGPCTFIHELRTHYRQDWVGQGAHLMSLGLKYHTLGGLSHRNVSSSGSRDWKSGIKLWAGPSSLESSCFWGLQAPLACSLIVLSPHPPKTPSLCLLCAEGHGPRTCPHLQDVLTSRSLSESQLQRQFQVLLLSEVLGVCIFGGHTQPPQEQHEPQRAIVATALRTAEGPGPPVPGTVALEAPLGPTQHPRGYSPTPSDPPSSKLSKGSSQ